MIQVLIADDHAIVCQGLRQLLALADDMKLVGEVRNGWEVMERIRAGGIDLLLTDMTMPGLSGIDLIKRIREEAPQIPVLVLSMHGECQVAARAIKAGAAGYLTKDSEPEILLAAIRQVAAGGHYISPELASRLAFASSSDTAGNPHLSLSDREYQVFMLLASGHGLNEIADEFHLSAKTISTHKFRLMQKMELASLSDLVRYAVKHGLLEE